MLNPLPGRYSNDGNAAAAAVDSFFNSNCWLSSVASFSFNALISSSTFCDRAVDTTANDSINALASAPILDEAPIMLPPIIFFCFYDAAVEESHDGAVATDVPVSQQDA